ncbi:MAG: response regulator [Roseococcus sp.]|nr:response regulator [Roseococcus sp.]
MHVLLIEDDTALREALAAYLQAAGHRVTLAGDGDAGLAAAEAELPDVVVTDLIMPGREGIETLLALRRRHPRLPVIVMSGGGRLDARAHLGVAERLGAVATLAKPFRPALLLEAIARAVTRG